MNVKDAALQILKDVGRPLGSQQLVGLILETGLWTTEGQTLVATNYAQMITEIRRTQQNGGRSRFIPHERGYSGLSRWMGEGQLLQIGAHKRKIRFMDEAFMKLMWETQL